MEIVKVTIEYDTATYIAEGEDAQTWRQWMLQAENDARAKGTWVWNSWTRIEDKSNAPQSTDKPFVKKPLIKSS